MEESRKRAYRQLLYRAMLDIRPLANRPRGWWSACNPLARRRYTALARRAGDLANLFHNLAWFSAREFQGFDEERFWKEHDRFRETHGPTLVWDFRSEFEQTLTAAATSGPNPV